MISKMRTRILIWLIICLMMPGLRAEHVFAAQDPGKVASLSLSVTGQLFARLQWKEATGNANGYTIIRDGKAVARVNGKEVLVYTDETNLNGKSCTYTVRPHYKDSKGNFTYGKAAPEKKIVNGYTYKKAADGSVVLTGYTGKESSVRTPTTVDGGAVKAIGDSCFRGNVWIQKLYVSEGVEQIGDHGFEACSSLKSAVLPGSLRKVGDGSFNGCAQLRYCDMPEGITSIGKGAFLYCTRLVTIDLPESLTEMGDFAFAGCEKLNDVIFDGNRLKRIPDRAFCKCGKLEAISIPASVKTIGKRAFSGCNSLTEVVFQSGDLAIGDYVFEQCDSLNQNSLSYGFDKEGKSDTFSIGFGAFSLYSYGTVQKKLNRNFVFPDNTRFEEGAFYASGITGIASRSAALGRNGDFRDYVLEDGALYSADKKTLAALFSMSLKSGYQYFDITETGQNQRFTLAEGVERIAPYAFCGFGFIGKDLLEITLSDSLEMIEDHAFTRSSFGDDPIQLKNADGSAVEEGDPRVSERAFENYQIDYFSMDDVESLNYAAGDKDKGTEDRETGRKGTENDGDVPASFEDIFSREQAALPEGEEILSYDIASDADGGVFDADRFKGYLDIHDDFREWCQAYREYNKGYTPVTRESMPYIFMYTGEEHYRQMTSALNGDAYKTSMSVILSGDDYREMYLMMDQGLFAELSRGRMPGDLVLYSGITTERVVALGDPEASHIGASGHITDEMKQKIIDRIGKQYVEDAIMSTTADLETSFNFSSGSYGSNTIVIIYASKKALDNLGAVCVDGISIFSEEEILFNRGAKYRIMDVGTVRKLVTSADGETGEPVQREDDQRTYVRLQLLGGQEGTPEIIENPVVIEDETKPLEAPGITSVLARDYGKTSQKMKVVWTKVKGAASYKVYWQKEGSSSWKTISTKQTYALASGMKTGSLYRIRVAAVDKAGKVGTKSKMYYLLYKTVSGISVEGKKKAISVKWKKASGVDGYHVVLAADKELKKRKTTPIKGKDKTSYTIKNQKTGVTRYIAMRLYKVKNGKTYLGFMSSAKKVKVK